MDRCGKLGLRIPFTAPNTISSRALQVRYQRAEAADWAALEYWAKAGEVTVQSYQETSEMLAADLGRGSTLGEKADWARFMATRASRGGRRWQRWDGHLIQIGGISNWR